MVICRCQAPLARRFLAWLARLDYLLAEQHRCAPSLEKSARRCATVLQSEKIAGAPEEIRTPDPQIRSLVLYPAELRARRAW
jgi:hypothetical protein